MEIGLNGYLIGCTDNINDEANAKQVSEKIMLFYTKNVPAKCVTTTIAAPTEPYRLHIHWLTKIDHNSRDNPTKRVCLWRRSREDFFGDFFVKDA